MRTADAHELLLRDFDSSIEAWKPNKPRSGCAATFRADRAELQKIRTAFKRRQYQRVIDMRDNLDTIVRPRVPSAVITYCQTYLKLYDT